MLLSEDCGYYTLYIENPSGIAIHSVYLEIDGTTQTRPQTIEPKYQKNVSERLQSILILIDLIKNIF